MIVAFTGPPCGGKTTLSAAFAERHGIPRVSAGDVARGLAENDHATRDALAAGEFAPADAMDGLMAARIVSALGGGRVVLDGYPRYMEQAADLLMLGIALHLPTLFVRVWASPEVAGERHAARARPGDGDPQVRIRHYLGETARAERFLESRRALSCLRVDGTAPVGENVDRVSLWAGLPAGRPADPGEQVAAAVQQILGGFRRPGRPS